ncbi:MAG TPA: response regulator [Polyangia bacterium]|nr:response regulator [Polyangia bacterium]
MSDLTLDPRRPILVVDDDQDHRATTSDFLRQEGYRVVEAANGRLALEHLLAERPQPALILLDVNMPVMTGAEVIKVLQSYLRLSRIPIVLVSVDPSAVPASPNVVARLAKPCLLEDLLAAVQAHAQSADPAPLEAVADPTGSDQDQD